MTDNNLFFEIFKNPADHKNWGKHIEYARAMVPTNELLWLEYSEALKFLALELDKGFLKRHNAEHPITRKIHNKAEWQVEDVIQFANTLRTLKRDSSGYQKLISKLLPFRGAESEGIPFAEIAEIYLGSRFQVHFLEEREIIKTPDMEVLHLMNKDHFFLEVSFLRESKERSLASGNYGFLFWLFHDVQPVYYCTGRQKTIIPEAEYEDIFTIVASAKERLERQQEIVYVSDSRLEFWLVPYPLLSELDIICKQNNTRKNDVTGLPLDFNEASRLIKNTRIKDKSKQIPNGGNGLIYFPTNPMFLLTVDVGTAAKSLSRNIERFPNLIGVVLYSRLIDPCEELQHSGEDFIYSMKMINRAQCRRLLFVKNKKCNLVISEETLGQIYELHK